MISKIIVLQTIVFLLNLFNMAEQRISPPKLTYLLNSLIVVTSRQERGAIKNQIRVLLETGLDTNQTSSNLLMIEQLLAFGIHSERVCSFILHLDDKTPYLSAYSSQFLQIGKKYLESKQMTKLDGEKNQAKIIKSLIASKLVQDHSQFERVLQQSKKDQIFCAKFMSLMAQLFAHKKPSLDCTNLVVFCFNLLRVRAVLPTQLTVNTLKVMSTFLKNIEGLKSTMFARINEIVAKMVGQNLQYQQICLQVISLNIKYCQNQQEIFTLISEVLKQLCVFYNQKLQKFRKQKKEGEDQQQQVLQEQKNSKSNIPKEISKQLCIFLLNSYQKLKQTDKQHFSQKSTSMISLDQYRDELIQKLQLFTLRIFLFVDCSQVAKLGPILIKINQIQRLYLSQCLINCSQFQLRSTKQQKWQQKVLNNALLWLKNQSTVELNKIKQLIGVPISQLRQQEQVGQELLMDYIKKTVQSQFQFEFNKESMKSVSNLFCYLLKIFTETRQQAQIKDLALQMAKMLLNLNQSCEKQYRAFMVQLIIKIITVYGKVLLKDNQFLMEVLSDKLTESNLFKNQQQILSLAEGMLLGPYFYDKILKNIQKGVYLSCQENELEIIFDILFMAGKQKMQEIINAINNGDSQILSWEWAAYIHVSGKKKYGNNWQVQEKQFKVIRQKMMHYPLQFENDVANMESIFRIK